MVDDRRSGCRTAWAAPASTGASEGASQDAWKDASLGAWKGAWGEQRPMAFAPLDLKVKPAQALSNLYIAGVSV